MIVKKDVKYSKIALKPFTVFSDGKSYYQADEKTKKPYPVQIGQFLCDFYNDPPFNLIPIIDNLDNASAPINYKDLNLAYLELMEEIDKLDDNTSIIWKIMIHNHFTKWHLDLTKYHQNNFIEYVTEMFENFKNTLDYFVDNPEIVMAQLPNEHTIEWYFKIIYNMYAGSSVLNKFMVQNAFSADCTADNRKQALSILTDNISSQKIEYRIAEIDDLDGLIDIYSIYNFESLTIFELLQMEKNNVLVKICKNCGCIFVDGRSDAIYCSGPAPQDITKTCRQIGAQVARTNKEKTDITVSEYRKLYLKLKMTIKRHPENKEAKIKLDNLTTNINSWRKKLTNGETTVEEYLNWLKSF